MSKFNGNKLEKRKRSGNASPTLPSLSGTITVTFLQVDIFLPSNTLFHTKEDSRNGVGQGQLECPRTTPRWLGGAQNHCVGTEE